MKNFNRLMVMRRDVMMRDAAYKAQSHYMRKMIRRAYDNLSTAERERLRSEVLSRATEWQREKFLAEWSQIDTVKFCRWYFRDETEIAEPAPRPKVTIFNPTTLCRYRGTGRREEDDPLMAYHRLGRNMARSGRDQLPSEWIEQHGDDGEASSWWQSLDPFEYREREVKPMLDGYFDNERSKG